MVPAKILIVEDESIVASDIEHILTRMDYEITGIASSGEEAIQMVAENRPDLVLMDMMLRGEMHGIETAEAIRAKHNIPVVFLTALSDENTLQRAKLSEAYGYLLKPFEERELRIGIEMALYKHQMEEELHHYRVHLEEMIQQRTAELTAANEQLRREIDERIHAQGELLKAKDEAESANRAKSEFLANMSHELRTPLNSIIGLSRLMKMQTDNPDFREYLENITSSGQHLLEIINDILDISKIEAGRMEFEMKPVRAFSIIASCISIMAVQLREKNLMIATEWSVPEGTCLMGEERRLQQIFLNLISNAIKFTHPGGKIVISGRLDKDFLEVEVKDTGIGIKQEHLQFIFEKFSQVNSGLNRETGGTGLGLAITKKIVEVHGGSISARSREGMESVFTVRLPVAQTH